jgi:hypothetical protein
MLLEIKTPRLKEAYDRLMNAIQDQDVEKVAARRARELSWLRLT